MRVGSLPKRNEENWNYKPLLQESGGRRMPRIKIDFSKCTGCRYCEAACALEHFKVVNPMKSRIRVIGDSKNRMFVPLISGPFTDAQCTNKTLKVIGGVEMDGCALCPASSCPSRHLFVEAGTGIPLKCDMCGEPPDPMCVKSCFSGALTLLD